MEAQLPVYGRRKLWKAARRADLDVGRDQVARLMRDQGIRRASRAKKRFTSTIDPEAVRAPDLVNRNFTASRPDALWVADFTYCSTWSGIVYVAFIIDVFSRRLVGWKAARSMTAALVIDALNMAAWTRRHTTIDGLICHTDAGSQYTSILYTERLNDVAGSRGSTRSACTQNSTTARRPKLRPTTVKDLSQMWHENQSNRVSIRPRPVHSSEKRASSAPAEPAGAGCVDEYEPPPAQLAVSGEMVLSVDADGMFSTTWLKKIFAIRDCVIPDPAATSSGLEASDRSGVATRRRVTPMAGTATLPNDEW